MIEPHVVRYAPNPPHESSFVVFDRDNTLIIDNGYTHRINDFAWNPLALPILSLVSRKQIPVAIATNRSGVARKMYTLADVDAFHEHLVARALDIGVEVVVIATCPHAASTPPLCQCRKPLPGLVARVAMEMAVVPGRGLMIGDKSSDLEAGLSAGLDACLVDDALQVITDRAWGGLP